MAAQEQIENLLKGIVNGNKVVIELEENYFALVYKNLFMEVEYSELYPSNLESLSIKIGNMLNAQ